MNWELFLNKEGVWNLGHVGGPIARGPPNVWSVLIMKITDPTRELLGPCMGLI